jgi:hypothetical protein
MVNYIFLLSSLFVGVNVIIRPILLRGYTMNITYQLTLNEYQEAANLHYKTGKRPIFIGLFLGLSTFMILAGTDLSNLREVIYNILFTFFAIAFYLLFTRMITAYQAKKMYQKNPILSKEVTLYVSGKGINPDKSGNAKMVPWEAFKQWKKDNKYYLLYTTPHQFNVIPLRAMNEKQIEEFEGFLAKYLK